MLESRNLFDGCDREGRHSDRWHMKQMVDLLGEPPEAFIRRSEHASRLFDDNGTLPAEEVLVVNTGDRLDY
jgi:hypothetical protein